MSQKQHLQHGGESKAPHRAGPFGATVRGPWLPPRGCYVICDAAVCS